jgi:hypothetical protein
MVLNWLDSEYVETELHVLLLVPQFLCGGAELLQLLLCLRVVHCLINGIWSLLLEVSLILLYFLFEVINGVIHLSLKREEALTDNLVSFTEALIEFVPSIIQC